MGFVAPLEEAGAREDYAVRPTVFAVHRISCHRCDSVHTRDSKLRNAIARRNGASYIPATIAPMRRLPQAAGAIIGLVVFILGSQVGNAQANTQKESPPDVPDTIQAPAGEEVVLFAHATGSQIYTCQAGLTGGFSWALKAPEAELHDRKDKVIGSHSAGPTWKLKDGSEVTGKAAAHVDSLDPDSIPWLLVKAESHAGKGLLTSVTTIQRAHTHGGKPSAEGCDASHRDAETKSSYTADYYFYAPAR